MPIKRDNGFLVVPPSRLQVLLGFFSMFGNRVKVSLPWRLFSVYINGFICALNEPRELTGLSFGPLFFTKGAGT